ncbi:MAG: type II secretion system GspH family protein [Methylococcaceae bacterium]|nr:type II secretion system GspH family protein [Methylococcaceae bacterium]
MTSKRHLQSGFSLLEILIAFSILALSLGVLLNIFSGGLKRAIVSDEYQQAVTIAQSKLAAAGVEWPLGDGDKQGQMLDKFNWTLFVQPINSDDIDAASATTNIQTYQVIVRVQWLAGVEDRQIELTSIKLSKKQ